MLVSYKNLNIYQQTEEPVLKVDDFHVDDGEFVYIIGRVGSGKSSLLKTIYCEVDAEDADEATVLSIDLKTIKRKQIPALRKQLGIIFQDLDRKSVV